MKEVQLVRLSVWVCVLSAVFAFWMAGVRVLPERDQRPSIDAAHQSIEGLAVRVSQLEQRPIECVYPHYPWEFRH